MFPPSPAPSLAVVPTLFTESCTAVTHHHLARLQCQASCFAIRIQTVDSLLFLCEKLFIPGGTEAGGCGGRERRTEWLIPQGLPGGLGYKEEMHHLMAPLKTPYKPSLDSPAICRVLPSFHYSFSTCWAQNGISWLQQDACLSN